MSASVDLIIQSLEQAAAAEPEIYDVAFQRYFELCPESRELLKHSDELMRGRMMEQVMSLLMDDDAASLDTYFRFEVGNHEGYGAVPQMYEHLLQACLEVVQKNCTEHWSDDVASAWQQQISVLLEMIRRYSQPD